MVFYGIRLEPGDRVLISQTEYRSHAAAYWRVARRSGIVVDMVPVDEHGRRISLDASSR
jgi:cysteine desulfurase/selenocysteine lyase